MWEENLLQAWIALEYWEALLCIDLNRIDYRENNFASFMEWFLISFSVCHKKNKTLLQLFTVINFSLFIVYFMS